MANVYPTRAASKWARLLEPTTTRAPGPDVATSPQAAARTFSRFIGRLLEDPALRNLTFGQAAAMKRPSPARGGAAGRSLPRPGPPLAGRPARLQNRRVRRASQACDRHDDT